MTESRFASINVSLGGVPKHAVPEAFVSVNGLDGDRQRNGHHHGGPDRAVSLFSLERINALRAEGHSITPGSTGENITVSGLDWDLVQPGTRLTIGPVELEVAGFASPCKEIIASFSDARSTRISHKLHPGWSRVYARVLTEGILTVGDPVQLHASATSA